MVAAPPLFLVADGMGGHAAGEVAAALAIQTLSELSGRDALSRTDIVEAVDRANRAILDHARTAEGAAGMGTTVAGVCLGDLNGSPHWYVFNVGDSRVYRFAGGELTQVTVDHSEVQELVSAGAITRDEARRHPQRNIVTRSLGTEPAPLADVWVLPADTGDRYLACSDGLTGELPDNEIREVLDAFTDAQAAADEFIRRALVAGAHDNVSVVVVDLPQAVTTYAAEVTAPRPRRIEVRHE